MKISDVTTVVVGARMRNWVFVKVATDEGLVGWGEATTEWKTRGVVGAVEDLAPLVVGQDPTRTEHLWQSMTRHLFWPVGVVDGSAVSGIDQALHDVKAQALGVPIHQLLGGPVRDRLRLYDHLGGGDPSQVYGAVDPARMAEAAARSVAAGFSAVKLLPVPPGEALPSAAVLRAAETVVARVREEVGDDVEVMLDLHGRTSPAGAIAVGRAVASYRPWFLEEPVMPGLTAALPGIAAATGLPLATGERLVGRAAFRDLLATNAVAVVQPDVCHCGGVAELRRIAALAETAGAGIAPHNPLGPIATAHALHLAAATPNWLIQEQMRAAVLWYDDVVTVPLALRDGYVAVPSGPGLGTAVDEATAARHPYVPEAQVAATLTDGTVADW